MSKIDTFYKYAGFWWTFSSFLDEPSPDNINGPYCLECQTDLEFPDGAYLEDSAGDWELNAKWKGSLICPLCGKKHRWVGGLEWDLKRKISMILISSYRTSLEKVALDEPVSLVKVRDQDDKYFLAAKIGQKDGKRVGVVYFGEKNRDQNREDYSHIFIDLDDEQVRFDKSNKHPKDVLAKMKVEFPKTSISSQYKDKKGSKK